MNNINENDIQMMAMQSNMRLQERFQEGGIKVAEKQAESNISASREISVYLEKKFINERCKAIKSREYEEIALDKEGKMIVIKKNSLVDVGPSMVSNMANPRLWVVRRCGNPDDYLYELRCDVNGAKKKIFMDPTRITDKNYVLRKLSSQGIQVYGKSKALIPEMFSYFVVNKCEDDDYAVPDCPGWFLTLMDKLGFAKEGDLTWKKILCLSR